MKSVAQLLKAKGGGIYSISPDASVLDGVKMLAEKGVGAILAMEGDKLVGILAPAAAHLLPGRESGKRGADCQCLCGVGLTGASMAHLHLLDQVRS
jgi:hypothetical protein